MNNEQKTLEQALDAGLQHHRAGNLAAAEAIYQGMLQQNPLHSKALSLLGLIQHDKGQSGLAIDLLRRSIEVDPANVNTHNNLGTIFAETRQFADAISHFKQALALDPSNIKALNNLATALRDSGDRRESLAALKQAAALQPASPTAHYAVGVTLCELGDFAEASQALAQVAQLAPGTPGLSYQRALAAFGMHSLAEARPFLEAALRETPRLFGALFMLGSIEFEEARFDAAAATLQKALALEPKSVETLTLLGRALSLQGRPSEGETCIRQALSLAPDEAAPLNALGNALQAQGRIQEAENAYAEAIRSDPDNAETFNNLGNIQLALSKLQEGRVNFERAIALKPDFAEAHSSLGLLLWTAGNVPAAQDSLRRSLTLKPQPAIRTALDLMIPQIMGTKEEVLASRTQFERTLDALLADPPALELPDQSIGASNFYLAFHGLDDKDLLGKFARICMAACPSLSFTADHCGSPRAGTGRTRIGFLSRFIYNHSVSVCFSKVVAALAKTGDFDVHLISQHPFTDTAVKAAYPDFGGVQVQLPEGFAKARQVIADLKLDILVYLDIGMDFTSYYLALARLAPAQCVLGGHPVTTGIPNVDYFISSAIAEIPAADSHYSETLIRPPMSTFYYERPALPQSKFGYKKTRAELGLPAQGRLYLCPMKLQKMHPDFDAALAAILQQDAGGYVVLFNDSHFPQWGERLRARLEKTVPAEVRGRILFLPWIKDGLDFANINQLADVVLDPFHFGMGSTAITTYATGTPAVTLPSEFLRGRSVLFYSELMDLPECVADSTEDFVRKAIAIASEPDLRNALSARILRNNNVLYENHRPIQDLVELFQRL